MLHGKKYLDYEAHSDISKISQKKIKVDLQYLPACKHSHIEKDCLLRVLSRQSNSFKDFDQTVPVSLHMLSTSSLSKDLSIIAKSTGVHNSEEMLDLDRMSLKLQPVEQQKSFFILYTNFYSQ